MNHRRFALLAAVAGSALVVGPQTGAQLRPMGSVASYWMSADTVSGLGAGMMGGGGRAAMMGAMMSGRGMSGTAHMLHLFLGSARKPNGEPTAEHLPPEGLGVGPSLPLVTPQPTRAESGPAGTRDMEKPRGRLLVFWGCGEHARPGQPAVLDFAKMTPDQMPSQMRAMRGMMGAMRGMGSAFAGGMAFPAPDAFATWGEWPNERSRETVPANGSLVGEHNVRGNYTPDIHFAVTQANDFLPPFSLTSNAAVQSGAVQVAWQPMARALAFFGMAVGGGRSGDFVIWTSSEVQNGNAPDYAGPEEISRLVQQRVLLSPQTTQCAVPAEAVKAMGEGGMLTLTAFGPTATFSYPPRPANAKPGWAPEWVAKLRTHSMHMGMLGMEMPGMGDDENGDEAQDQDRPPPPRQPEKKQNGLLKGLKGLRPF